MESTVIPTYAAVTEMNNESTHSGGAPTMSDFDRELILTGKLISKNMLPAICAVGVIFNTLAGVTFMGQSMRKSSCNIYLFARSCSDSGFLITLFIFWLEENYAVNFLHTNGPCQGTVYLSYVCAFVSVWLVVCVTSENYIRVCKPFVVNTYCTSTKATVVTISLFIFSLVVYNFPLWTSGLISREKYNMTGYVCDRLVEYEDINLVMTYNDTVITLLIPSSLIFVLMILILITISRNTKRRESMRSQAMPANKKQQKSKSPTRKVTKMLFFTSTVFLILNLPSHCIRMKSLLSDLLSDPNTAKVYSGSMILAQLILQLIYYLSFAVNLQVYLLCGDNFRKEFIKNLLVPFQCIKRNIVTEKRPEYANIPQKNKEPMNRIELAEC